MTFITTTYTKCNLPSKLHVATTKMAARFMCKIDVTTNDIFRAQALLNLRLDAKVNIKASNYLSKEQFEFFYLFYLQENQEKS